MDIEAKFIQPTVKDFKIDPKQALKLIDDHTIGVIAIMGNHYGGQYDPVWELNKVVEEVNKEQGNLQVGIHVDAASGGFIAPFQEDFQIGTLGLKTYYPFQQVGINLVNLA